MKTLPFQYQIFDDFLTDEEFQKISNFYKTLTFKEKSSDLFTFLQTDEIASDENLNFFKNGVSVVIKNSFEVLFDMNEAYFTIFGSYYRKNDFLLCHNDCLDERGYAFILYLNDFESGELVLYENDCFTIHKEIFPKKNRLVAFKVSEKSHHEVSRCLCDGRMAVTGWINHPELKNISLSQFLERKIPENVRFIDGLINIDECAENNIYVGDLGNIEPEILDGFCKKGPFVSRRWSEFKLEDNWAPSIKGYSLYYYETVLLECPSDYILINDKINQLSVENTLDVFIFFDECKDTLHLVTNDGTNEIVDVEKGAFVYLIRRNSSFYFDNVDKNIRFIHMIYT